MFRSTKYKLLPIVFVSDGLLKLFNFSCHFTDQLTLSTPRIRAAKQFCCTGATIGSNSKIHEIRYVCYLCS